ncbi:MAG: carbohydrate kinase family protein [Lachnospiraceae bacterium]|nr:carbohydrate kinase family protein [Lachnospiraceae bacterium]
MEHAAEHAMKDAAGRQEKVMNQEKEYDLVCIGTALLDSIIKGFDPKPVSASGYRAGSGSLNVGGEAVNEAATAAKMGLKTEILCSLGTDPAGDLVVNTLKDFGVDVSRVIRSCEHPTPITTMFVNKDGSRQSITNEAHKYNFHPEQYEDRFLNAKTMILGSLFRAPFNDPEVVRQVLQKASSAGMMIFADTKLPNFRQITLEEIGDSLGFVDYITPNEDEAKFYTKQEDPEAMADVFLGCGVKNVIIKLGSKGCFFKNARETIRYPAFAIDAVDATGAGDSFVAGFAAMKLEGCDDRKALAFANACGAVCSTAVGATTAIRDKEQILKFLEENKRTLGTGL